ncbi:MAG: DUF4169 family protein [Rhodobacteraceae bacterium]|nr:DUF4169 family protein [Paracoccaceae bacterium]
MSGKVISLKAARKARTRAAKSAQATENAAKFGRTKAEKRADADVTERLKQHLDNHQRDRDDQ